GIDKPDIRFVAHAHIPRAVEAYYQEIGRAGRDGAPAKAVLLFNHADVFTQERLIQGNHPPEAVLADVWRTLISVEEFDRGIAALAGQSGVSEFEVSAALKILEREGKLVRGNSPQGGRVRTIRALECLPFRELNLDLTRVRERERRSLLLLKRMTAYAYSKGCRRAFILDYFGEAHPPQSCHSCDVCTGKTVSLEALPYRKSLPPDAAPLGAANEVAVTELKQWRKELARELQIPAFIIFNDATLLALARALPTDREAFLAVKGTGESRWERFGAKVVEVSAAVRAAKDDPISTR
ncbi:MAG TPA: HRDC domain-containing protein, partial [Myxococcaceae bacterium]|nr:HRDC domain-containing protein [Myxococcaceae bacterium]